MMCGIAELLFQHVCRLQNVQKGSKQSKRKWYLKSL